MFQGEGCASTYWYQYLVLVPPVPGTVARILKKNSTSNIQHQPTQIHKPYSTAPLVTPYAIITSLMGFFLLVVGWMLAVCQSFLGSSLHVRFVHPASASSSFQDPKCSLIDRHAAPSNENSEPVQDLLVSDAEALLACYAYLKRHMRLENSTWTQKERRQRMKVAAQPHFFWEEDLSKIAARVKQEMLGKFIEEEEDDDDDDDEHRETPLRPSRSSSTAEVLVGRNSLLFPTEPSPTHARRSQSAKRTWTDPDFRERWYESRWGDKDQIEDPDTLEEKELENQVRALPSGFLGSPELSGMTEEEIQDAIKTYLTSNRQSDRVTKEDSGGTQGPCYEKQMEDLETGTSTVEQTKYQQSRDSLFTPDEATSKEAQRKRSERGHKVISEATREYSNKRGRQNLQTIPNQALQIPGQSSDNTGCHDTDTKRLGQWDLASGGRCQAYHASGEALKAPTYATTDTLGMFLICAESAFPCLVQECQMTLNLSRSVPLMIWVPW